jgi:hypothetical protein
LNGAPAFWLKIFPITLGAGTRLFAEDPVADVHVNVPDITGYRQIKFANYQNMQTVPNPRSNGTFTAWWQGSIGFQLHS